jgi:curli production assembly/transport component CsgF
VVRFASLLRCLRQVFVALALCVQVQATEMVYVPVNPAFGGNPLHGPNLLATAQAINNYKDSPRAGVSVGGSLSGQSALQQFNELLQRSILSRIATASASSVIGSDGKLIPGSLDTRDFKIEIVDLGGGLLQIKTTDKASGSSTSFQVSQ